MFNHTNSVDPQDITRLTLGKNRYYKTPKGDKYPSITTVLSSQAKPGLEAWKQAMGQTKANKETKRCSLRGTAVHEIIEQYLKNNSSHRDGHSDVNLKIFNKLKTRLKKINNIHAQECNLYSDMLKVAGCVDCVAEYDGVLSIIDFKTSNGSKSEELVEDYFLQCTAYAIMYSEMYNTFIEDIVIMISPEKSNCFPMIYKRKITDYVKPLLQRISQFNNKG